MYHRLRKVFHLSFLLIYVMSFAAPMQTVFAVSENSTSKGVVSTKKLGVEAQVSFSVPQLGGSTVVDYTTNPDLASSDEDSRRASEELSRLGYTLPSYPVYQSPDGLTIEPIAAYNLIVDSNVFNIFP